MAQPANDRSNRETEAFFEAPLRDADSEVFAAVKGELQRQQDQIELIASENIVSRAVLEAQGSVLTNKYAEGYPGKRYYGGCEKVDIVENLAIERVTKLFGCTYANVQPHSGSQANQAVYMALIQPGDTIMGLSLAAGGHLTHGAPVNQSGKWFKSVQFGVRRQDGLIDYDEAEALAREHKPKLIMAGGSAYARAIDFKRLRAIADSVGAYLAADIAHYAGLVVAGLYPNPFPHAHIVTSTTHKTLRGPRGGVVLTNDEALIKKINSAVFPMLQGGPLMHVIAGKAVAFKEALHPSFKVYAKSVLDNARVLADTLMSKGFNIVTGGTDCHLVVVDLTPKSLTGKAAEKSLEHAGMTCNKNAIPFDPLPPMTTSGIRLGSPAATTRGFGTGEFRQIGLWMSEVLEGLRQNPENNSAVEDKVRGEVLALCRQFPIYSKETR
jgi:glycine hydroxymethyltransferase